MYRIILILIAITSISSCTKYEPEQAVAITFDAVERNKISLQTGYFSSNEFKLTSDGGLLVWTVEGYYHLGDDKISFYPPKERDFFRIFGGFNHQVYFSDNFYDNRVLTFMNGNEAKHYKCPDGMFGYNYQIPGGVGEYPASSELSNGICIGNYFFDGTNWYKISDSFFPFLSRYNYSVSFNDYQNLINGEAFNSTTKQTVPFNLGDYSYNSKSFALSNQCIDAGGNLCFAFSNYENGFFIGKVNLNTGALKTEQVIIPGLPNENMVYSLNINAGGEIYVWLSCSSVNYEQQTILYNYTSGTFFNCIKPDASGDMMVQDNGTTWLLTANDAQAQTQLYGYNRNGLIAQKTLNGQFGILFNVDGIGRLWAASLSYNDNYQQAALDIVRYQNGEFVSLNDKFEITNN